MYDLQKIDNYFPLKEYRTHQREAILEVLKAFNNGYKFVFLEAPTGSGKSAIGFTIAQMAQDSFYLAPQKFLQDQLTSDFGENGKNISIFEPMIDLKGRNSYPCTYWDRKIVDPHANPEQLMEYKKIALRRPCCDVGQCKREGKSKLEYCVGVENFCPYFQRLYKAMDSKICLMNFHSFLFQTAVARNFTGRELLICDEGHNSEGVLLKFIEVRISDRHFQTMGIRFPKLQTVSEYIALFKEINLQDIILDKLKTARATLDAKMESEWEHLLLKYKILLESDPENWVCVWEEVESKASRTVTLKPIFIDAFAEKYLFSMAEHILIMSATILSKSVMCDALGIPEKDAYFIKVPSTFPKESRPIYFRPCGSLSFKEKIKNIPKLIEAVNKVCQYHKDERGIIHTHTFEIAEALANRCADDIRSRFLYQRDFEGNKQLLLEKHRSSNNTIILAPAMHEGLDLQGSQGTYAIICKTPYPSKADPQIAARMQLSSAYYDWLTALKLIQSTGRIIRSEQDYGVTYVLDSDFETFIKRARRLIPKWFYEAIIWDN